MRLGSVPRTFLSVIELAVIQLHHRNGTSLRSGTGFVVKDTTEFVEMVACWHSENILRIFTLYVY